jgi:lipopolysaccharide export LptBFGC system permease protein LptF
MNQTPNLHSSKSLFRRTALSLIIALWLCPTLALACDSDAAPGLMEYNRILTQRFVALSIALLIATVALYFKRHKKGLPVIILSIILLAFHPAWFYGGGGGDCGMSMVETAKWITGFLGVGVAYQLTSWLLQRNDAIRGRA